MRYSLHEIEKHHASGIELNRRPSQGPAPPTSGSGGLETGATASEIRRKATQIGPAYNKGVLQLASRGRQAKGAVLIGQQPLESLVIGMA